MKHPFIVSLCFLLSLVSLDAFSQAPVADFGVRVNTPTDGCIDDISKFVRIEFEDRSTGNPTSWLWDFGAGVAKSTVQHPKIAFFQPGLYTVTLTVGNSSGSDSETKVQFVRVYKSPTSVISSDVTGGCPPLTVAFTDASIQADTALVSWLWDFGDGTKSTSRNPSHVYNNPGANPVTLQVTDGHGCINKSSDYLVNISTKPSAGFTSEVQHVCETPVPVRFTNTSTGSNLTYVWDFGDGTTSTAKSPTKYFDTPGSYLFKLVATDGNGCSDVRQAAAATNVNVFNVDFTPSVTSGCAPLTVTFKSIFPASINSWAYHFGDGDTVSSSAGPVYAYQDTGRYTVSLFALSDSGCVDTVVYKDLIRVYQKPDVNYTVSSPFGCTIPFDVVFTDLTYQGSQWDWQFSNDSVSALKSNTIRFVDFGDYDVRLTVTDSNGCSATVSDTDVVRIAETVADFGSSGTGLSGYSDLTKGGCAPVQVSFQDWSTTTGTIEEWLWQFGDQANSFDTLRNPIFTYTDTGKFNVTLIVRDVSGCVDTFTRVRHILAGMKPALFEIVMDTTRQCYRQPIEFTGKSDTLADRWGWRFGDEGVLPVYNPNARLADTTFIVSKYTFVDTAVVNPFFVKFYASHNLCPDTLTLVDTITILPPIARASQPFACDTPATLTFVSLSVSADSLIWEFNDSTAYDSVFTRLYRKLGPEYFTLYAIDTVDDQTICIDTLENVVVHISKIVPGFMQDRLYSCLHESILFTDTSVSLPGYVIDTAIWFFGDGNIRVLNASQVLHSYTSVDTFDIRMVVSDNIGCYDTVETTNSLSVHQLPTPYFKTDDLVGCVPFAVQLTDSSYAAEPIIERRWVLTDIYFDTLQSRADTLPHTVSVSSDGRFYNTFYEMDTTQTLGYAGIYNIALIIRDSLNCVDTMNRVIVATRPEPQFDADTLICYSNTLLLHNLTSLAHDSIFQFDTMLVSASPVLKDSTLIYVWDFGDGSDRDTIWNSDSLRTLSHQYIVDTTTVFTVTLYAIDSNSCVSSLQKNIMVSRPIPEFFADTTYLPCYSDASVGINFTDTSSADVVNGYRWDFGDRATSQVEHPFHFYNYPDTFDITLTVTNIFGCIDTLVKEDYIIVDGPTATFDFTPKIGCAPQNVLFFADSAVKVDKFVWGFGDGNEQEGDSTTSHKYNDGATYYPYLLISDKNGCEIEVNPNSNLLIISAYPDFAVNRDSTCSFGGIQFANLSSSSVPIDKLTWDFGNGVLSNVLNPLYFYDSIGIYDVRLKIYLNICSFEITKPELISIFNPPKIEFSPLDTVGCTPLLVSFKVSDSTVIYPVESWSWDFDDGGAAGADKNPVHEFEDIGSFTYQVNLQAVFENGCPASYVRPTTVTVYPIPEASFEVDTSQIYASSMVGFVNRSVGQNLSYQWDFGDGTVVSQQHPYHIFKDIGHYEVALVASTSSECRDTSLLQVEVQEGIEIPNVITPNGDGVNDEFRILISGYKDYSLTIFNRWGEILFYSQVMNEPWDGRTKSGTLVPDGTYFYIMTATSAGGHLNTSKGYITVIRK